MRIVITLPFRILRTDSALAIEQTRDAAIADIKKERREFETQVRAAIHGAYAGILCTTCGQNVFRGEGMWVHGNGGKAYCLEPCWRELKKS